MATDDEDAATDEEVAEYLADLTPEARAFSDMGAALREQLESVPPPINSSSAVIDPPIRRRRTIRSKSIAARKLTQTEQRAIDSDVDAIDPAAWNERPRTRGDCEAGPRPCPWVGCQFHLYLDVNDETGTIKLNHPELESWDLVETCALDVADRGGTTLEEVGKIINLTRERIRQVAARGMIKIKARRREDFDDSE